MSKQSLIEISAIIIFIIFFAIFYDDCRFSLSTDKSTDINNPVKISAGEKIDIKVSRQKSDWSVYVYFDDNVENKTKLSSNFFSFTGSITAPRERGIHKLTIYISVFEKTTYYYLIE